MSKLKIIGIAILFGMVQLSIGQVAESNETDELVIRFKKSFHFEHQENSSGQHSFKSERIGLDNVLTGSDIQSFDLFYHRTHELKPSVYKDELLRTFRIKTNNKSLAQELRKYQNDVEEVYTPTKESLLLTPNDYDQPWTNSRSTDWALDMIKAKNAWNITQGSSSIKIAIVDSGFDINHEDLTNKIVSVSGTPYTGTNCVLVFHGTSVAGHAAAETNNGIGKSSIGYNCSLMLYSGTTYSNIVDAALDGAAVINCSWGRYRDSVSTTDQSLINAAANEGAIIVAGAGNDNGSDVTKYFYPASYDNVISVMAVDFNKRYACLNCTGNPSPPASNTYTQNDKIDIAAPGHEVESLYPSNSYINQHNLANGTSCALGSSDGYELNQSGTSLSSPIVAGVIGLMLSINPYLKASEVENILKTTGEEIHNLPDNLYFKNTYGTEVPLVDAHSALLQVPACMNGDFVSHTFSTTQSLNSNCGLNMTNTVINNGADISFAYRGEVYIDGTFSTGTGTSLQIVPEP